MRPILISLAGGALHPARSSAITATIAVFFMFPSRRLPEFSPPHPPIPFLGSLFLLLRIHVSRVDSLLPFRSPVADPVDRPRLVIGNEERAVRHDQHVHRTAPGVASLEPPLREDLVAYRPAVFQPDARHAVADGRGAGPGPGFRDEDLVFC